MAAIPDSTKTSLRQRLSARARDRWTAITRIDLRFRAPYAYVDAVLTDGQTLQLCRIMYAGYANMWGLRDLPRQPRRLPKLLPAGYSAGTAEDALDTACGLYLADPIAWT